MPSTSDVFGPIPANVVLDGNGNGTLIFQAVGSAKRVTNLFAKVSTSTLQAQCSLYVGTISDATRVFISNSGSTGFNARGSIDLTDGQILYVVWTGGDAGATAYATFTGRSINFSDLSNSEITAEDPIAAGDGSLIFPAIKSPNFVAGVSGWEIARDGTAEFNNVTARGTLLVTDVDGTYVKIFDENPGDGAVIELTNSRIRSGASPFTGFQGLLIQGPDIFSSVRPGIEFVQNNFGASETNLFGDFISLTPNTTNGTVTINGDILNGYGIDTGRGRIYTTGIASPSGAIGGTETTVITGPSFTYKANRAYRMVVSGLMTLSVANNRPIFKFRKTNNTGAIIAQTGITSVSTGQEGTDWIGEFWIGASDVTATLVYTAVGSGAFNVTVLAGTGFTCYDFAPASDISAYKTQLT